MTPDENFHKSIFRNVHGRWPKGREFDEWFKRLGEYWTVESFPLNSLLDSRLLLEAAGLDQYAREVYWTSTALLMKKYDEGNRDE
jgi:hypothetical protein